MIRPNADDLLAVAIETIERDIGPHVDDEYAASLCRTVSQLLRSVRARVDREGEALTEDNEELRILLASLRGDVPAEVAEAIDRALASSDGSGTYRSIADLQIEATQLRAALVEVIDIIDVGSSAPDAVQVYLGRQLLRQRPWLVDAFTGPRR